MIWPQGMSARRARQAIREPAVLNTWLETTVEQASTQGVEVGVSLDDAASVCDKVGRWQSQRAQAHRIRTRPLVLAAQGTFRLQVEQCHINNIQVALAQTEQNHWLLPTLTFQGAIPGSLHEQLCEDQCFRDLFNMSQSEWLRHGKSQLLEHLKLDDIPNSIQPVEGPMVKRRTRGAHQDHQQSGDLRAVLVDTERTQEGPPQKKPRMAREAAVSAASTGLQTPRTSGCSVPRDPRLGQGTAWNG